VAVANPAQNPGVRQVKTALDVNPLKNYIVGNKIQMIIIVDVIIIIKTFHRRETKLQVRPDYLIGVNAWSERSERKE
jgi:hypothetical protein